MNGQDALLILREECGVENEGHFVCPSSGLHTGTFIDVSAVYPYTRYMSGFADAIARQFLGGSVEVVVGDAVLSQWMAHHLSCMRPEVLAVPVGCEGGLPVINRSYEKFIAGRKVLVAQDVIATGTFAAKVIEMVRTLGGDVTCLGTVWNRGGFEPRNVVPNHGFFALVDRKVKAWNKDECLLCARDIPIDKEHGLGRALSAHHRKEAFADGSEV